MATGKVKGANTLTQHNFVTLPVSNCDNVGTCVAYVGTERQTNVIINTIGYVHFACSEEINK